MLKLLVFQPETQTFNSSIQQTARPKNKHIIEKLRTLAENIDGPDSDILEYLCKPMSIKNDLVYVCCVPKDRMRALSGDRISLNDFGIDDNVLKQALNTLVGKTTRQMVIDTISQIELGGQPKLPEQIDITISDVVVSKPVAPKAQKNKGDAYPAASDEQLALLPRKGHVVCLGQFGTELTKQLSSISEKQRIQFSINGVPLVVYKLMELADLTLIKKSPFYVAHGVLPTDKFSFTSGANAAELYQQKPQPKAVAKAPKKQAPQVQLPKPANNPQIKPPCVELKKLNFSTQTPELQQLQEVVNRNMAIAVRQMSSESMLHELVKKQLASAATQIKLECQMCGKDHANTLQLMQNAQETGLSSSQIQEARELFEMLTCPQSSIKDHVKRACEQPDTADIMQLLQRQRIRAVEAVAAGITDPFKPQLLSSISMLKAAGAALCRK